MSYTYRFPRPQLAVDAVVFARNGANSSWRVLLIERGKEPYKGRWAFPGGYFDMDDYSVEHAAVRELEEETGVEVNVEGMQQLRTFSHPERDPRERVISVAHVTFIEDGVPEVEGRDDASDARWFAIEDVHSRMLAFDHHKVYAKALKELMYHDRPEWREQDRAEM
jgi:8-oxo-dGTP diphosphatase